MIAFGHRSDTGRVHSASSQETSSICSQRSLPSRSRKLLDRLAVPAGVRPHEPAGVMVDDDGQVPLAFADRDLVEPEALEVRVQVALALLLGGDTLADTPDRPPRDPHQQTDRGVARVDRQPRDT
jgi:hypothetical protein